MMVMSNHARFKTPVMADHRHFDGKESAYNFETPDKLIAAFRRDIARWNRENSNS